MPLLTGLKKAVLRPGLKELTWMHDRRNNSSKQTNIHDLEFISLTEHVRGNYGREQRINKRIAA